MPVQESGKSPQDPAHHLQEAERLLAAGDESRAEEIYATLTESPGFNSVALFRLGEIANRGGRARVAYDFHQRAFAVDPGLAARILPDDHLFHDYKFRQIAEVDIPACPLCQAKGEPYWAFNMVSNSDFNVGFDPVRLWLLCEGCHHLFAATMPENLGAVLSGSDNVLYQSPEPNLLPVLGQTIGNIHGHASGNRFLDIGIGAGEMLAVAMEYGFDVTGLEIRPAHAQRVAKSLGIEIVCEDFAQHETTNRYDVICMGDVLEHIADPVSAVRKAGTLLNPEGIFWISTPNFESAFSRITKDQDPMKRVCEHLNYFSFHSLEKVLEQQGCEVIDYHVSARYNGSMEVTAIKNAGSVDE